MAQYVYGSSARDIDVRREMEGSVNRGLHHEQHRRQTSKRSNIWMTLAVVVSLCFFGFCLINYVYLQGELTNTIKRVSTKHETLSNLKSQNDELSSRIASSIDLSEIEAVAKSELGMTYAQEGQIITYSSVGNDYMRKVESKE